MDPKKETHGAFSGKLWTRKWRRLEPWVRVGIKFSLGLRVEIWNHAWISSPVVLTTICLEVCGVLFLSFKISACPIFKACDPCSCFSSPVLGRLADSSDKMPNDQGKWVRWPLSLLCCLLWPISLLLFFYFYLLFCCVISLKISTRY